MQKTTPPKIPVCAWLGPEDDRALDEILDQLTRASRHLVTIAAIRAGLNLLRENPETVLRLIVDQPRARHVRLRTSKPL